MNSEQLVSREWFSSHKKYYENNIKNICVNCESTKNLMLHHIVPLSKGGTNRLTNVVFLCEKCHRSIEAKEQIQKYSNELDIII